MAIDSEIKTQVLQLLAGMPDPWTDGSLVEGNLVQRVDVKEGRVTIRLSYDAQRPSSERWRLEDEIYARVEKIPQVADVTIDVRGSSSEAQASSGEDKTGDTGTSAPPQSSPAVEPGKEEPARKREHAPSRSGSGLPVQKRVEGVKAIIAVASGKGGVGKSTVACNLALALARRGWSIGLLDIDIYGPSLPTLFGIHREPELKQGLIQPLFVEGLRLMSLGFLMQGDQPVIWRGPLVGSVVRQFLYEVDWRGTDYLVVDLPPGTGDAQLTLAQSVPIDGVVIVTTPSDLALIDAARGIRMFRALKVEVLGIVENMSHFVCEKCGTIHHIFGNGGGAREAARLGTELVGGIPLDGELRQAGDSGKPIVISNEQAPSARAFLTLAEVIEGKKPIR